MKRIFLMLTLLTVLSLSACSAFQTGRDPLEGTSWKLASYAGQPALPETNVTIHFADAQASGEALAFVPVP